MNAMIDSFDVVIAGGGVMGCAVAYFLASDPGFGGRVLVIERDPTYANSSTARSWGGLRQQFSIRENVLMSLFGLDFADRATELLAVEGETPVDLGFRRQGYLFLASAAGRAQLEGNIALQNDLGASVELLPPKALAENFPWLNLEDIAGGGYGGTREGWIDPNALLQGFRRKARSLGVRFETAEVVAVECNASRIAGVRLNDDRSIACGALVNAAGPQAGALARLCGIDLPVAPRKRMTYVFDCRESLPPLPLTIDPSGVAFRPEGAQYLAIVSPPPEQDRDSGDLEPEYATFEEVIWPILAARVPAFEAIKLTNAWAGHYDYNAFDQNAILGRHPEIENLLLCNGFSGHGIQQAPAVGRAVAELILHGGFCTLDLSALSYTRIIEGRPLLEANIV